MSRREDRTFGLHVNPARLTRGFKSRHKSLDQVNEELSSKSKVDAEYLHPTKGIRHICARRLRAQFNLNSYPFGSPMYQARKKNVRHKK